MNSVEIWEPRTSAHTAAPLIKYNYLLLGYSTNIMMRPLIKIVAKFLKF